MPNRRGFLTEVIAAGGAVVFAGSGAAEQPHTASKGLRILILGGTGNIGPYHVRAAVQRGHHVSVFSRGRAAAEFPDGVEHLIGDRSDDLSSLRGRDWDAVLDIATFGPNWVRTLGEALRGRVGHYTFISTVSVYDSPAANRLTDETSRVLVYDAKADPYSNIEGESPDYGALKVLCEREAERQFPGRTLVVRPGYIAGPGDTHAPLPYWLLRMQRGGEVLAAGDPSTPVQFIDVRDLAEWIVRMIERHGAGLYNAVGPVPPTDLCHVIDAARSTATAPPKVTWVPGSWLRTQKDSGLFSGLLFWEINRGALSGIGNARALAQGLTTRSLKVTLADTLRLLQTQPSPTQVTAGYRPKAGGGFERVQLTWTEYLQREKAVLAAWHASTPRAAAPRVPARL
jgi:2'-hydroxyisoflavone reductase